MQPEDHHNEFYRLSDGELLERECAMHMKAIDQPKNEGYSTDSYARFGYEWHRMRREVLRRGLTSLPMPDAADLPKPDDH